MEVTRNPYVKKTALWLAVLFLVCATVCFFLHPAAGAVTLFFGAAALAVYLWDSRRRYRAIRLTADEIDRILHGKGAFDPQLYDEGELSILHSELRRLVIRLGEQSEQLQADKTMLANSLADISHQLRTPLTAIRLNNASMQQPTLAQEKRQMLCRATEEQLERVDWLISALLKLARLDAGAVKMKGEPVALSDLVRAAAKPLELVMEIKGQRLETAVSGGFVGDMDWTTEAVGNLLKNCTEHMAEGTIRVTGSENPIYTELIVQDSGKGFTKTDLPHLFERFYKGENSSEKSVGIGLALTRRILTAQGATIKASNAPEGGARFSIRFYKSSV